MMRYLLQLIFVLHVSFPVIHAQGPAEVDLRALDDYFARMAEAWDIPSLTIGIVKDGNLVFTGNYGILEEGKEGKPDANTLYAIASNSKAFTSAIIGMLVQEGKLDWDDKVKKFLPYFELYDPWVSDKVTIRDLLSHRVGLGTFSGDVIWYKSSLTSEEIIRRARYLPSAFEFRAGYGYSNLMFITAGEIIKQVTGKTWSQQVQERILDPLEMNRTITSSEHLHEMGNYATPHGRKNGENFPIAWEDWGEIGAMGGIISSINDLGKWMIFNLNNGIVGQDTLLSRETRNMVWTPHNNFMVDHTAADETHRHFQGYGLGWALSDYDGKLVVSHSGGFDGMISRLTLLPDEQLGIVVLTNGMVSPATAATRYAMDRYLGLEEKDWSSELLKQTDERAEKDLRIEERIESRITGTSPSLPLDKYAGTYRSDIYGDITITRHNDGLRLDFEYSPRLSATLKHWHYDVWEIDWDEPHAWFSFGTLQFVTDNNMDVTRLDFDVPNDDIFFNELKPYRIGN